MRTDEVRELLVEQLRLMLGPMLEQRRTPNTAENAVDARRHPYTRRCHSVCGI